MVIEIKSTIEDDLGKEINNLETRHIVALENRVDKLRAKLIAQGLKQLCRYTERKNRLNLRYFLRKAFKAK